jgi:hypothetical protein
MGRDLGPNLARYIGPCRPDNKIFQAMLFFVLRASPSGPAQIYTCNLSIRVSTVTQTPEWMGQYVVPGLRLRMMKGDAKGMTEDEVVLKTSLNLTSS